MGSTHSGSFNVVLFQFGGSAGFVLLAPPVPFVPYESMFAKGEDGRVTTGVSLQ